MLSNLCGTLDATKLGDFDIPKMISTLPRNPSQKRRIVIWFQCPWAYYEVLKYNEGKTIRNYDLYDIEGLKKKALQWRFEHFEDKDFIRECILYGYRHCRFGYDGKHSECLLQHVSHVFTKKFNR